MVELELNGMNYLIGDGNFTIRSVVTQKGCVKDKDGDCLSLKFQL